MQFTFKSLFLLCFRSLMFCVNGGHTVPTVTLLV